MPGMTPAQIIERLSARMGPALLASFADDAHPRVHIATEHWRDMAMYLRQDAELDFDWLACLSAVDYVADDKLAVVYDLMSYTHRHTFAVKVFCDRKSPAIPSVMDLWPAADWHEREAYDLMGIDFPGHTDLRRILLADDWVGHPLRKDYIFPREYHGIPGTYEQDWQQKPDYPK